MIPSEQSVPMIDAKVSKVNTWTWSLRTPPVCRYTLKVIFQHSLKPCRFPLSIERKSFIRHGQGQVSSRFCNRRYLFQPSYHIKGVLNDVGCDYVVEKKIRRNNLSQRLTVPHEINRRYFGALTD